MEVALFLIIGFIAVFAAAGMLLVEKAVHSALFLIVNFLCVALLYILLDAPFLAMIQIAVYAGAIMVLFLFVIMLLNADEVGVTESSLRYREISMVSVVLAIVFVLAMAFAFLRGDIDNQQVAEEQPLVRVFNFASDTADLDIYINDVLISANPQFTTDSEALSDVEFMPVDAGDVSLGVAEAGADPSVTPPLPLGDITLDAGEAYSIVLYGEGGLPLYQVIETDLSEPVNNDLGRVVVFNAFTSVGSVAVANISSDFILEQEESENPELIVPEIAVGEASEAIEVEGGNPYWGIVTVATTPPAQGETEGTTTISLVEPMTEYAVEPKTSELVVFAERRLATDNSLSLIAVPISVDSEFAFGSPQAIGESLFIQYVLPFEIVAVLLLAAMVGAIVLAQREDVKQKPGRSLRRKVSRPLTAVITAQTGSDVMHAVPELEEPEAREDEAQAEPAGD